MRGRVIKTLYKKEMLDVLRDKKTVVMMIIVPIILYPLLMLAGIFTMNKISASYEERAYRIAFADDVDSEFIQFVNANQGEDYKFQIIICENVTEKELLEMLNEEQLDLFITNSDGKFIVNYLSSVNNSSYAASQIKRALSDYNREKTKNLLESYGLNSDEIMNPVKVAMIDSSSSEESAGSLMAVFIPFMLVTSLLLGTMYPAIDTTAGERERGTLETVLTLPITNQELIFSKFLTVATIGLISAILNLISMAGVSVYMYKLMTAYTAMAAINMSKFMPVILIGVLCTFAFAIFISAITMCVCAFARTYKEANNYMTPLMLVIMFLSFAAMIPNVVLNSRFALVPVANICLLIRDILSFKYNTSIIFIVLLSNVVYGFIAVYLLGKIYKSEAILFGESLAGVRIFERRSNMKKTDKVLLKDMFLVLGTTILLMIYVGSMFYIKSYKLGTFATQLIVILLPIFAAWYTKCDIKKTFRLNSPGVIAIPATLSMAAGAIILSYVISIFASIAFEDTAQRLNQSVESILSKNVIVSLFIMAMLPAICEEAMFRGYVLSAFLGKCKAFWAIVITGLLFGVYHLNVIQFCYASFLGIVLCYTAYMTDSIWPGIIIHFINNGLSVLQVMYPKKFKPILMYYIWLKDDWLILFAMIISGLFFLLIAVALLKLNKNICKKNPT